MIMVAGPSPRSGMGGNPRDILLPSGRSTIFSTLFQEFMVSNPGYKVEIVSGDRATAPDFRDFRKRATLSLVQPPYDYAGRIAEAAARQPDLLVIDRLDDETASSSLEAVRKGLRVMVQFDTILWGAHIAWQLSRMGISREQLAGLSWIISVQRLAALCSQCKQPASPDPAQLAMLRYRHPHLVSLIEEAIPHPDQGEPHEVRYKRGITLYCEGNCPQCKNTGRQGDVAVFDILRAEAGSPFFFDQPSLLSLEESILHRVIQGQLALDDLLGLEIDQLQRTYHLLANNDFALSDATARLEGKLAELEAANRVLIQRTEVMISLQEIAQVLITSQDLYDLAARVCRRAGELCNADRTILYYLHSEGSSKDQMEVLAVKGWEPGILHAQVDAEWVIGRDNKRDPTSFSDWPPGVPPATGEGAVQGKKIVIEAGLRVPLYAQDRLVGVMIVQSTRRKIFTKGEVALLQTFANQAALAIQRAGLIEELRSKIVQLEAAQAELVKKERMERELEIARQVQQSVLPRTFPTVPGFNFAAKNEPARMVGGDFYDVFMLDPDHFGIVVGDVSDKGMPAALYMALTRSLILAEARRELSPQAVLSNVNNLLLELGEGRMYVTAFYGVVEVPTRRLFYTRAGHDRPFLFHRGLHYTLDGDGTILGILEGDEFHLEEVQVQLESGDRLVLYTDGLSDVLGPGDKFYDLPGLETLFTLYAGLPPTEMCAQAFADLAEFRKGIEQFDDMTMLVVELVP